VIPRHATYLAVIILEASSPQYDEIATFFLFTFLIMQSAEMDRPILMAQMMQSAAMV
jgi:hypothetical protein